MNTRGKHYVFLPFCALVFLSACVCVRETPVVRDYQREEKISTMKIGDRKRAFASPVFFPESQLHYGMFQNYLHYFIDRPLFFDRATRYPAGTFAHATKASFLQDWEIAKKYEFDGLGCLNNGRLYQMTDQFLREANLKPDNFYQFPQLDFQNDQNFTNILHIAQSSPYTARPNGKMLFLTYYTAGTSMDKHRQTLKTLRDEFGDTFTVAVGLDLPRDKDANLGEIAPRVFRETGQLPSEAVAEYRKQAQEALDVFGALQLGVTRRVNNIQGDYSFGYSTELFKYLLPTLLDLMKRPENQGRPIGFCIHQGYINHLSGVTDGEYGTARLRDSLDAALLLNPDFLLFFEWNEANENTGFQPTLYNSMAVQRILKYYFRKMRGQSATPNSGDDLSIPNLILSHRETLKLGERLQFELLNVPDADKAATYQATLVLRNANGKIIFRFPVETFAADKLQAITYSIPSEQLADQAVILPELETIGADGKKRAFSDFQYVRIQPTMCFNYKAVRQPLRDMLKPEKSTFKVSKNADGSYKVAAAVEATETLASLEIVDNGSEAAALDKANEFDPDKNFVFVGTLSAQKSKTSPITIKVSNTTNWKFRPLEAPQASFGNWRRDNDVVHSSTLIWPARNAFIVTVPKNEVADASLDITIDDEKYALPLADLVKNHKAAKVLRNCRIDLEKFNKLADVPARIKAKNGSLTANLISDFKYPIYQMRAVTESGKIFRGKPVLPEKLSGEKIRLNVFSATSGKVMPVEVAREQVPVLSYCFDPARGDMLRSAYESFYDAQLGGGFIYLEPFHANSLVPPGGIYNPKWEKDGNANVLVFDGISNYINFPREAFPRGSFTLEFEIYMNATEKPQVLFRHFGNHLGSISVYAKNGKLWAGYGDRALKTTKFQTDLDLPVDKWAKVKIAYDLNELTFEVNGKQSVQKFSGQPPFFRPAVFGGHTKKEFGIDEDMQFFKGKLKNISIKHYVDK